MIRITHIEYVIGSKTVFYIATFDSVFILKSHEKIFLDYLSSLIFKKLRIQTPNSRVILPKDPEFIIMKNAIEKLATQHLEINYLVI